MFRGELVTLRALEATDAERLHDWFNDGEVIRNLASRYPVTHTTIAQRLAAEWSQPSYERSVLGIETDGRLVGICALRDASPEVRDAELDLMIGDKSAWGRGVATDAMRVLCRYGFEQMGLHRIHLWVYTRNVAAVRVYEKVGFSHEGIARQSWFKDGQMLDAHLMSLLEGELR